VKPNNNINNEFDELNKLNESLSIPYQKSKEEIWQSIQQEMSKSEPKVIELNFRKMRMFWAAAVIVLLISSGLTIRFFHYTVESQPGQLATFFLPDGSEVSLAARSKATYYPLWWSFSRKVTLQGEAFFKVRKGKQFSVKSKRGITSVLGTSFDIYARNDNYRVICYTGKVSVKVRGNKNKIVLTPGEKAEINHLGEITFTKETKPGQFVDWLNNQFVFTSVPVQHVLEEMARRYNVTIIIDKPVTGSYTGDFSASTPVEQALTIVCKPFGLTFVKKDEHHFIIK
jgi:ferric-dicitrate binding protein FerR (iron transport regulator)